MSLESETFGTAPAAIDAVLRKELQVEVRTLFDDLSPTARAALTLHFWEGLKLREIAEILESSTSTVGPGPSIVIGTVTNVHCPGSGVNRVARVTWLNESAI